MALHAPLTRGVYGSTNRVMVTASCLRGKDVQVEIRRRRYFSRVICKERFVSQNTVTGWILPVFVSVFYFAIL